MLFGSHRKFADTRLLIASNNAGKVQEIAELLSYYNVQVVSAAEHGISSPEETGTTFKDNAELKAKYYCEQSKLPALADDSGLCVDALGGEPGVYSARWAESGKDFKAAMKKVEEKLKEKGKETSDAQFVCALCLYWPDGHKETFEGKVKGTLTFPPRGEKGFGYDPIFIPRGYDQTFGELSGATKQEISHRADAFKKLKDACFP